MGLNSKLTMSLLSPAVKTDMFLPYTVWAEPIHVVHIKQKSKQLAWLDFKWCKFGNQIGKFPLDFICLGHNCEQLQIIFPILLNSLKTQYEIYRKIFAGVFFGYEYSFLLYRMTECLYIFLITMNKLCFHSQELSFDLK